MKHFDSVVEQKDAACHRLASSARCRRRYRSRCRTHSVWIISVDGCIETTAFHWNHRQYVPTSMETWRCIHISWQNKWRHRPVDKINTSANTEQI